MATVCTHNRLSSTSYKLLRVLAWSSVCRDPRGGGGNFGGEFNTSPECLSDGGVPTEVRAQDSVLGCARPSCLTSLRPIGRLRIRRVTLQDDSTGFHYLELVWLSVSLSSISGPEAHDQGFIVIRIQS